MSRSPRHGVAQRLAEAFSTGAALGAFPDELAPRTVQDGYEMAAQALVLLGLEACGLRVAPGLEGYAIAGPVLPARLLRDGAPVALGALRHPAVSAAVVAVLGGDLDPDGGRLPPLTLLPALDVAATRFDKPPCNDALVAADLGGHALLVVGRRAMPANPGPVRVRLAAGRARPAGVDRDLLDALAAAAASARRLGGLPSGALLVAAGLSAPRVPVAGEGLRASFGTLGRVGASFV